jgi:hypothetical protein
MRKSFDTKAPEFCMNQPRFRNIMHNTVQKLAAAATTLLASLSQAKEIKEVTANNSARLGDEAAARRATFA